MLKVDSKVCSPHWWPTGSGSSKPVECSSCCSCTSVCELVPQCVFVDATASQQAAASPLCTVVVALYTALHFSQLHTCTLVVLLGLHVQHVEGQVPPAWPLDAPPDSSVKLLTVLDSLRQAGQYHARVRLHARGRDWLHALLIHWDGLDHLGRGHCSNRGN
eukprot:7346-Heterococcus_DN1.PRE.4